MTEHKTPVLICLAMVGFLYAAPANACEMSVGDWKIKRGDILSAEFDKGEREYDSTMVTHGLNGEPDTIKSIKVQENSSVAITFAPAAAVRLAELSQAALNNGTLGLVAIPLVIGSHKLEPKIQTPISDGKLILSFGNTTKDKEAKAITKQILDCQ